MYEKDKRARITLRLNDEQFLFIKRQTDVLGITPSDYLRMLVNGVIYASKGSEQAEIGKKLQDEVLGRENDKTILDNKLQ